ncbi:MAG: hypothetical protein ABSH47_23085 [Bryobacteraceae bacterium]|jgi:hypothetical protein
MKTRMIALAALAALVAGSALATDATLLSLVPPDAKVVAGVRVTQVKASPLGQYLLARLQPDGEEGLQKLIAATGFDPRRDVSEILLATPAPDTRKQGIIAVRGVFDPARIQSVAIAHGCTSSRVLGVTMFTAGDAGNSGALALPDATTAMLGDVDSVKAAIGRYRSKTKPSDDLQKKVQAASQDASGAANDVWLVTLVPLSEFVPKAPEASPGGTPQNIAAFQTVQQASAGVRFTAADVRLAAQLVMRSDKDAQAMADVIRFLVTMVQSHRERDPVTGNLTSLLSAMTLNTNTNVTQVALVLPEAQVEQLLNALQQHRHAENRTPPAN